MLNTITVMGRLTRDPERRVTPTGLSVTSFSVAVDRDFGNKETDFLDCVAWRKTAEFVDSYFRRGDLIVVNGSLHSENYIDRNGNKRTAHRITAEHVYFGGSKKAAAQPELEDLGDDDSDLPWVD